jgi:hypothetical protein
MSLPMAILTSLASAQSGPGNGAAGAAQDLVRMHEAWGPKASTPGVSLAVRESSRSGQVIKFRLTANGASRDGAYSLLAWPVTQKAPSRVLSGVTLDASGLAICAGTPVTCGSADNPNDPIDITLSPVQGEPVRLALVSADGATKVFVKLVPIPLRDENRGCSVEATLLTPGAELVLIEGSGFPPTTDLTMDSESGGERQTRKGKTDADGRYVSALLPYREGVPAGTTKVNLKASKCAPSVTVPWGRRK